MSVQSVRMKLIALKNATNAHAMACGTVAMPWPIPTDEERAAVMTTFNDLCGAMQDIADWVAETLPDDTGESNG